MSYADYAYYTETFLGSAIAEADFPRLSLRASDFIDYITRNKAGRATDESVVNALSKACCAIAEQMQIDERNKAIAAQTATEALSAGGGEVKSETVGGYSVSYTTAADYVSADDVKRSAAAYFAIAQRYLVNTGLLYRGGCNVCSSHGNGL